MIEIQLNVSYEIYLNKTNDLAILFLQFLSNHFHHYHLIEWIVIWDLAEMTLFIFQENKNKKFPTIHVHALLDIDSKQLK